MSLKAAIVKFENLIKAKNEQVKLAEEARSEQSRVLQEIFDDLLKKAKEYAEK